MWAQLEGGLKASTWKMTRSQGFSVLLQPNQLERHLKTQSWQAQS